MLCQHWGMPWKRDVLNRALVNNFQRTGKISIELCGALSELMGLKSQLVEIPAVTISQLPTPVLIPWLESFAILYEASEKELIIAIPEQGITRKKRRILPKLGENQDKSYFYKRLRRLLKIDLICRGFYLRSKSTEQL